MRVMRLTRTGSRADQKNAQFHFIRIGLPSRNCLSEAANFRHLPPGQADSGIRLFKNRQLQEQA